MVDKERRKKLAFHLRQLSVGLISNDEFAEAIMEDVSDGWPLSQIYNSDLSKSGDLVFGPMLMYCWGLYSENRNYSMVGADALSKDELALVARCILFLRSDREYEWPYFDTRSFFLKDLFLSIITLGYHFYKRRKEHKRSFEEWKKSGDFDLWPFYSKAEYADQLNNPSFLAGA